MTKEPWMKKMSARKAEKVPGRIHVTDQIIIEAPLSQAVNVLHNIALIGEYEPKLNSAIVTKDSKSKGTYLAEGKLLGFPWSGKFTYELNENGFWSEMVEGPGSVRVEGGFFVKEVTATTCEIKHVEIYHFSHLPRFLFPLIKWYLQILMKRELAHIKEIILKNR